jgi:hypothetical protein
MAKPLTTRERNEVIGCAIDDDDNGNSKVELYNSFLKGNGFKLEEDKNAERFGDDLRVGAAILTMAHFGYVDDFEEVFVENQLAPNQKYRWGRAVLYYNGFKSTYKLKTFYNVERAKKEF